MSPNNQRHPHNRYPDDFYPRTAEENDARLQPDPELALSTGQASRAQIWLVAVGAAAIAGLVLYGISQTPNEPETAASPPAQTTGAAPSAQDQQQQQEPKAAPGTPAQEPAKPGPSDSSR